MIAILGICFGMEYLHFHNIIHRDLKPGNILLDSNFYPKICYFGLPRRIILSTYISYGTLLFTAPEQHLMDYTEYDKKKANCYSFGMTIYSILHDQIPFSNTYWNEFKIRNQIISGARPKIDQEKISKEMEQIITSCWNKEPEKQPSFKVIHQELLKETGNMIERKEINKEEIEKFLEYCGIEYNFVQNIIKESDIKLQTFVTEDFEDPNPNTNLIGEGSFGSVYKLLEKKTNKYYAVKIIKNEFFDDFSNSVNALSRVNYPTIVHLYGVSFNKPYYLITDFIPNKTVQFYIDKATKKEYIKEWNIVQKMIIILGISFGMKYLHSCKPKIVHRDLKPNNILLESNFYPKICDFGISKILTEKLYLNSNIGTPMYIAPEVENEYYDPIKADVFSFGLTIYSILYDKIPFSYEEFAKLTDLKLEGHRPKLEPNIFISQSMIQLI